MASGVCIVLNNQHQLRVDDFVRRCEEPKARMLFQPYTNKRLRTLRGLDQDEKLPLPIFLVSGRMGAEATVVGDLVAVEYKDEVPQSALTLLHELLPVTDTKIYGTNLLYLANARKLSNPIAIEQFRKLSDGTPLRRGRWPAVICFTAVAVPLRSESSRQSANEPEEAVEGYLRLVFRRHRHRESSLRSAKIKSVLRLKGRLTCEVAACGFDFQRVYGPLGREYAHVHHLRPLADVDAERNTKLSELAIVCPNCHAMIHRGGLCRQLDEVSAAINASRS